jgi:hypothetical protein
MQSFQTAKNLLSILMYVGWAFVELIVIAGFVAMSERNVLLTFIGAGLLSVFGFLIIGIAQMGLAQIAAVENTGQMLEIMRKEAQIGYIERRACKTGTTPNSSNDTSDKIDGEVIRTYQGYLITTAPDGVEVEGEPFPDIFAAEKRISLNPK